MRVVVLGAGFGGLELTTRLSEELGDDVDVVLIDQADGFVFGFSKLDVMFGRTTADAVLHPYRRHREAGRAVRAGRRSSRSTRPPSGSRPTPARSRPTSWCRARRRPRPGGDARPASRAATSSTRVAGAFALRDVLAEFAGGRVIVGVTSTPFKCPPAPSETALLVHDYLVERGRARAVRDRRW